MRLIDPAKHASQKEDCLASQPRNGRGSTSHNNRRDRRTDAVWCWPRPFCSLARPLAQLHARMVLGELVRRWLEHSISSQANTADRLDFVRAVRSRAIEVRWLPRSVRPSFVRPSQSPPSPPKRRRRGWKRSRARTHTTTTTRGRGIYSTASRGISSTTSLSLSLAPFMSSANASRRSRDVL